MFSLIVTIIAIALTVALAGATLYYGGSSWADNNAKAQAAKMRSEALQITGAIGLYKSNEGAIPSAFGLADLEPHYLKQVPEGTWSVDAVHNKIIRSGLSDRECVAANEALGYVFLMTDSDSANYQQSSANAAKGVPLCAWVGINQDTPCCSTP